MTERRIVPDAVYDPDEAAHILNLPTRKALYRLAVPYVPVSPTGKKRLYRGRDLLDWMERSVA